MEWIEKVNQIDHLLHSIGVPAAIRGKAIAEIATILAQAGSQRRTAQYCGSDKGVSCFA